MTTDDEREKRADEREAGAVEREIKAESRSEVVEKVLPQLQETLMSLDRTMASFKDTLDLVGESNIEIKRWRRRATLAIRLLTASLVLLTCTAGSGVWLVWQDGHRRERSAIERIEEQRILACQARNTNQQDDRLRFLRVFDALAALGVNEGSLTVLRRTVGSASEEDKDCDRNGRLTADDYIDT